MSDRIFPPEHYRGRGAATALRVLVAVLALGIVGAKISPADDYLDPNFAAFGFTDLNLSETDGSSSLDVDSLGRIYVGGNTGLGAQELDPDAEFEIDGMDHRNLSITRYHSDGTLDIAFGGFGGAPSGTVVIDTQLESETVCGVERLNDDSLICAALTYGNQEASLVLLKLLPNGWLDESFGQLGKKFVSLPEANYRGSTKRVGDRLFVWMNRHVLCFTLDGELDPTFANAGRLDVAAITAEEQGIGDVAFVGDTLVIGLLARNPLVGPVNVVKVDANGGLIGSFGVGGFLDLTNQAPTYTETLAMAATSDKITIGMQNVIVQVDHNGNFDMSFGASGIVELLPEGTITDIVHQPYGMTTFSFWSPENSLKDRYAVARLNADGSPDQSFGNTLIPGDWSGWLRLPFGTYTFTRELFSYANGKVLIMGDYETSPGGIRNISLLRTEPFAIQPIDPVGGGFDSLKNDSRLGQAFEEILTLE